MSNLVHSVRSLADRAVRTLPAPEAERVKVLRARLDEPLRVAIAGRIKAGKSTLLNALVGERLAATDAGECTKIVTWFRGGHRYQVTAQPLGAPVEELRFAEVDGALRIDLGRFRPDQLERIDVTWPSQRLVDLTLIDTPGLSSLTPGVSARTIEFLTPEGEEPSPADAVIYLMRRFHESDVRFLESVRDDRTAQRTSISGIGVVSRADEVGGCTHEAMQLAGEVAGRWRANPALRQLCHTVVPVAGLLAEAGANLREQEFRQLATLSALPDLEELTLSADRFATAELDIDVAQGARLQLLRRLGLYGVRVALGELRQGRVTSTGELARTLVVHSGLDDLRQLLLEQFEYRADVLRARSVLTVLAPIARRADRDLAAAVERVVLGAHEFVEIEVMRRLRSGEIDLPAEALAEAERLLGGDGAACHRRLGLDGDCPTEELRATAEQSDARFRRLANRPRTTRDVAEACATVVRTCESLLSELERQDAR